MKSQDRLDFLGNPFRTITSTLAFLGLCAFVITSIYILAQKYRQARSYQYFSSRPTGVPNLESARAFSSGVDSGRSWTWQTQAEIATADLVDMREGVVSDDGEVSSIDLFPYLDTESNAGNMANYSTDDGTALRILQHPNTPKRHFIHSDATTTVDSALWVRQKKAGEELDGMRTSLRSRMVIPAGVIVGKVGDSRIAQRRRTTSNRGISEL